MAKAESLIDLLAMNDVIPSLEQIMARATGEVARVAQLTRLSGGANMESSAFVYAGQDYVLRRAHSAEMMAECSFGHDVEAALVRVARAAGVKAPEIVAELSAEDGISTGYVMRRVEAEVNPVTILADPPPNLIDDIARELARIHAITPRDDLLLPVMDTAAALDELAARFQGYGGDRPIIALAIKWCRGNMPTSAVPRLVHGDFRMGNLMVDRNGLAAVLDWEVAHWGDPHNDLAYGCMNVWRFGYIDKPAFGCADLETYFVAYEAAGGMLVDRVRFRFWLVYRTLWWALGCMQMADIWRTSSDRSVERVVIGRRTSENEMDLLMLLEGDAPETERLPIRFDPRHEARRHGEPSATEMLEAVRDWIGCDIKSKAQGRDKFMAAVAMNALGMLIREAESPVQIHDRVLADDLLAGRKTLTTPGLLGHLRTQAYTKLANDVPKYSALAKAREIWGG